jgi:hypothetical protein
MNGEDLYLLRHAALLIMARRETLTLLGEEK